MSKIVGELNAEIMKKVIHDRRAKLFAEIVAKTGSKQSVIDRAMQEIESLREQVEKLTKERDELVNALDNEMVVTHMGVFNAGDDPKVALNKIYCYAQDLGKFFAEDACKEQLATLAEQNEKLSHENASLVSRCLQLLEALYLFPEDPNQYTYRQCYKRAAEALSLPDLASPVLNKYRAEGMRMAAEICEHISDEYREREGRRYPELKTDAESGASDCESSIRARADELEKTND